MFQNLYLTFKPSVEGTQKNRLIETILLSAQNLELCSVIREILWGKDQFTPPYLVLLFVTH